MPHINRNITSAHVSQLYWNIENQITSWWKKNNHPQFRLFSYTNIISSMHCISVSFLWCQINDNTFASIHVKSATIKALAAHFPKLSRAPVSLLWIYWRMQHDIIKFVRNQTSIANILSSSILYLTFVFVLVHFFNDLVSRLPFAWSAMFWSLGSLYAYKTTFLIG